MSPKEAYDKGFPSFTSVGGYTLVYVANDESLLCACCAAEEATEDGPPASPTVFWEGPPEHCEGCNKLIESAYGDPDSPDGES